MYIVTSVTTMKDYIFFYYLNYSCVIIVNSL